MNTIKQYLKNEADKKNKASELYSQEQNDKPCVVCKNKTFVQKFRNVVGEISGYLRGSYSIFRGSFYGTIDGHTKTLPVLSCRECGNEREITTYTRVSDDKLFWDDMYYFYFGLEKNDKKILSKIPNIYLDNPKDTLDYIKENYNYERKWYNELKSYPAETWAEAGFKGLEKKKEHKFLFWKWTTTFYEF